MSYDKALVMLLNAQDARNFLAEQLAPNSSVSAGSLSGGSPWPGKKGPAVRRGRVEKRTAHGGGLHHGDGAGHRSRRAGHHSRGRSDRSRGHGHGARAFSADDSPVPLLRGYQLMGDSMLSRITPKLSPPVQAKYNHELKRKQLGAIVHGQTACQLAHLLAQPSGPALASKGILLIGTNDLLKAVPLEATLRGLRECISLLSRKMTESIVLTVPPVPKLAASQGLDRHLKNLSVINTYIVGLSTASGSCKVMSQDITGIFIEGEGEAKHIKEELYQMNFKSGDIDGIHFNESGISALMSVLMKLIEEQPKIPQDEDMAS